ncbi:CHAT domain-containing protein [Nonomuraea typhae]|uniref:CHAT domain-containing protein n=1 Tax=Nonomuraea typhae TaxID=2603600 RepID=UPI0012F79624|nr:CHAT domain-containing protein [Nonomuraea typhae]
MSVSPDYDELRDELGGSLPADPVDRAALATVAGDCGTALRLLEQAGEGRGPGDPALVRALAWTRLARTGRYAMWPDGCGVITPEMEAIEPQMEAAERDNRRFLAASAPVDSLELRLETVVVKDVLAATPGAQAALRSAAFTGTGQDAMAGKLGLLAGKLLQYYDLLKKDARHDWTTALIARCLATLYHEAGDLDTATAKLVDAQERSYRIGDAYGVAATLVRFGDWAAAPRTSPLLLDLLPMITLGADTDRAHEEAHVLEPDLEAAEAVYAEAERVLRTQDADVPLRPRAALALRRAFLSRRAGEHERAATLAGQAERMASAAGDQRLRWTARVHRALADLAAGASPELDSTARDLAAWARGPGSMSIGEGLGALCSQAGHQAGAAGRYEQAVGCHRLASVIHESLGLRGSRAQALTDLGALRYRAGDLSAARAEYEQAALLWERPAQEPEALRLWTCVRLTALLALHVHPLDVQRNDPDAVERTAARIRRALGELRHVPDEEGVEAVLETSRAAERLVAGLPDTGPVDRDLVFATWYHRRAAQDVLAWSDVLAPSLRGRSALVAGTPADGHFARAAEAARRAPAGQREHLLSYVYGEQGRRPEAAAAYRRFLDLGGEVVSATAELDSAGVERAPAAVRRDRARVHQSAASAFVAFESYDEAERELAALREILGADWWERADEPWSGLEIEAETALGRGDPARAVSLYGAAVTRLEGLRQGLRTDGGRVALADSAAVSRVRFGAARALMALREAALAQGRADAAHRHAEEAFEASERARARAFLDLLHSRWTTDLAETPELAAWRLASAEVTLLRRTAEERAAAGGAAPLEELRAAQDRLAAIETRLSEERPRLWRSLDLAAEPAGLSEVVAALPRRTVMLAYHLRKTRLMAWAVSGEGLLAAGAWTCDDLERQAGTFDGACRTPGGDPEEAGRRLAAMLLVPMKEALDGHPNVVIVPSGILHTVSFAALPWYGGRLGDRRTLSTVPSASTLPMLKAAAPPSPGGLLVLGDPEGMTLPPLDGMPASEARRLPASAVEACAVAGVHGRGTVLMGRAAGKEELLEALPSASLVHLGTHGQCSERAPLASVVLLAGGASLNVAELAGVSLGADLVVLSACETGRGGPSPGDDVQGLLRGVLASGARAAIVTLWQVHDVVTAMIMVEFHARLARMSPAAALRAAQSAFAGRSREEHRAAYKDLVERARNAAAGDPALSERLEDAVYRLESLDPWEWLADSAHPRHWAAFTAVGEA